MNLSGALVINKPKGMTSHDVVDYLRRILGTRKIGHAGTLDPSAEGILLVCINKATKLVQFLNQYDKEYEAEIKLGVITDTYDGEGKVLQIKDDLEIRVDQIRHAVSSFKGKIQQTVPLYSALKFQGKPMYQYARANVKVEPKRRVVEIKSLEILDIKMPLVRLRVNCSKGTYIRSLASELGEKLGCGAYLFSLRRTRVGPFKVEEALDLESIRDIQAAGRIEEVLLPLDKIMSDFPSVVVEESFASKIHHGLLLKPSSVLSVEGDFDVNQTISVKDKRKRIIAFGRALTSAKNFLDLNYDNGLFEYLRVI
jgi:tRNA pseudouridine55 synthase